MSGGNVVSLIRPPAGQEGRLSNSLTVAQAGAAAGGCRLRAGCLRGAVPAGRGPD